MVSGIPVFISVLGDNLFKQNCISFCNDYMLKIKSQLMKRGHLMIPGLCRMKMASPLRHIEIIIQQLNKFHPENENVGHFLDESAKVLQV